MELLVVIGIIALLISMLMPAISNSRRQSLSVACKSNLKQNYTMLLTYALDNHGYMFPTGFGSNMPPDKRWPVYVFKPPVANPPTMRCPSDENPIFEHSYVLNNHFLPHGIRYGATKGVNPSDIVVMGEKKSTENDYYMDLKDYDRVVEQYRHGLQIGSNYGFMDGHIDTRPPKYIVTALDPWDPTPPAPPPQPHG